MITQTVAEWFKIADRLDEGDVALPIGSMERTASSLASYIFSEVDGDANDEVTLDFGDAYWDVAVMVALAR